MRLSSLLNTAVFPLLVAISGIISCSSQARAVTFSGNVNGSWEKPTAGSINTDPYYTGVDTKAFTWGDPTLFKDASANQLVFEGSPFSVDEGSLFKIGDLTYVNGTVLLGTSVESVPLNLNLSFDKPSELDQFFSYQFDLQNTPNLSDDPDLNADFVVVSQNDAKSNFVYNGDLYSLSLTGFSQDNGETNVNEFRVREGEKTTAAIYGQINKVYFSKTVPEPGFPIGLSLLGVYFIARRKARKVK
ncbi:MAG: choice-of-anchor K domain-containing protein [Rivularia sp. (in: Bacteria)]|nr:choice-of-anchor K domain-containing protein [Rivularia sp. MS3]